MEEVQDPRAPWWASDPGVKEHWSLAPINGFFSSLLSLILVRVAGASPAVGAILRRATEFRVDVQITAGYAARIVTGSQPLLQVEQLIHLSAGEPRALACVLYPVGTARGIQSTPCSALAQLNIVDTANGSSRAVTGSVNRDELTIIRQ